MFALGRGTGPCFSSALSCRKWPLGGLDISVPSAVGKALKPIRLRSSGKLMLDLLWMGSASERGKINDWTHHWTRAVDLRNFYFDFIRILRSYLEGKGGNASSRKYYFFGKNSRLPIFTSPCHQDQITSLALPKENRQFFSQPCTGMLGRVESSKSSLYMVLSTAGFLLTESALHNSTGVSGTL